MKQPLPGILIVNPFGIGDVLFTTPLIHTLKDSFPGRKIGYLCNKRSAPLLRSNPYVDQVIIYERDDFSALLCESLFKWLKEFRVFINTIKSGSYGMAFDLSLNTNFGFFLWLAGVKKRIGYNYKKRGFYLTDRILLDGYDDKHIVEYYGGLLSLIGLELKYSSLELYPTGEDALFAQRILAEHKIDLKQPLVVVFPGGGASWGKESGIKQLPPEKYAQLIDKVIENYKAQVIILGDLKDVQAVKDIEGSLKNKVINLCGTLTLEHSAALIQKARVFIGNDGGPLHMAAALGVKTLSFFGPVDPRVYGPYPADESRHAVIKKGLECSPCYRKFRLSACNRNRECLEAIDVQQALEAFGRLLN